MIDGELAGFLGAILFTFLFVATLKWLASLEDVHEDDSPSDQIMTSAEIRDMVERHDGDPAGIAGEFTARTRVWLRETRSEDP